MLTVSSSPAAGCKTTVKAKTQTRRTAHIMTLPIAAQPEQMTTTPADLNVAIFDTSSSDLPEMDELEADKQLTQAKLDKYKFRKLIKHYDTDYPLCRFIQAQRKRRRSVTANIYRSRCVLRQIRRGALLQPTERPSQQRPVRNGGIS